MRVRECTCPPSLVVEWLCGELEERGIPGTVYAHTLLSLLHSHYCEHGSPGASTDLTVLASTTTEQSVSCSSCHHLSQTTAAAVADSCAAFATRDNSIHCVPLGKEGLLEAEEELILGTALHPDADLPLIYGSKTFKQQHSPQATAKQQVCCCGDGVLSRRARKRHKKQQQQQCTETYSPRQLQKLTALQCLMSASDQERSDLEELIDEVCVRLKVACEEVTDGPNTSAIPDNRVSLPPPPAPPPPPTTSVTTQHSPTTPALVLDTTTHQQPPPESPLATQRYFAAFPALSVDRSVEDDIPSLPCAWESASRRCSVTSSACVEAPQHSAKTSQQTLHTSPHTLHTPQHSNHTPQHTRHSSPQDCSTKKHTGNTLQHASWTHQKHSGRPSQHQHSTEYPRHSTQHLTTHLTAQPPTTQHLTAQPPTTQHPQNIAKNAAGETVTPSLRLNTPPDTQAKNDFNKNKSALFKVNDTEIKNNREDKLCSSVDTILDSFAKSSINSTTENCFVSCSPGNSFVADNESNADRESTTDISPCPLSGSCENDIDDVDLTKTVPGIGEINLNIVKPINFNSSNTNQSPYYNNDKNEAIASNSDIIKHIGVDINDKKNCHHINVEKNSLSVPSSQDVQKLCDASGIHLLQQETQILCHITKQENTFDNVENALQQLHYEHLTTESRLHHPVVKDIQDTELEVNVSSFEGTEFDPDKQQHFLKHLLERQQQHWHHNTSKALTLEGLQFLLKPGMETSDQMPALVDTTISQHDGHNKHLLQDSLDASSQNNINELANKDLVGDHPGLKSSITNKIVARIIPGSKAVKISSVCGFNSNILSESASQAECVGESLLPYGCVGAKGVVATTATVSHVSSDQCEVWRPMDDGYVGDVSSRESSEDRENYDGLADDEDEETWITWNARSSSTAAIKRKRMQENPVKTQSEDFVSTLGDIKLFKKDLAEPAAFVNKSMQWELENQLPQNDSKEHIETDSVSTLKQTDINVADQIWDQHMCDPLIYHQNMNESVQTPLQNEHAVDIPIHCISKPIGSLCLMTLNNPRGKKESSALNETQLINMASPLIDSFQLTRKELDPFSQEFAADNTPDSFKPSHKRKSIWSDLNANNLSACANNTATTLKADTVGSTTVEPQNFDEDQQLCDTFQSLGLERIWQEGSSLANNPSDIARQQMLQTSLFYDQPEHEDLEQVFHANNKNIGMWPSELLESSNVNSDSVCPSDSTIINPTSLRIPSNLSENSGDRLSFPLVGGGAGMIVDTAESADVYNQNDHMNNSPGGLQPSSCRDVLQHSTSSNFSSVVPRRTLVPRQLDNLLPVISPTTANARQENLLTSPRTHFRPIKLHKEATAVDVSHTVVSSVASMHPNLPFRRSSSGTLFLEQDLLEGSPKKYMIYKGTSAKSHEHRPLYVLNQESSLVPKFKVIKNEKFCQTDENPRNFTCNDSSATMVSSCMTPPPESDDEYDVFSFQKHDFPSESNIRKIWNDNETKENCWKLDTASQAPRNPSSFWMSEAVNRHLYHRLNEQRRSNGNKNGDGSTLWNNVETSEATASTTIKSTDSGSDERLLDTPAARAIWSTDQRAPVSAASRHHHHLQHQAATAATNLDPSIKALWEDSPTYKSIIDKVGKEGLDYLMSTEALPAWTMKGRESSIEKQIPTEWAIEESVVKYAGDNESNESILKLSKHLPAWNSENDNLKKVWSNGDNDDWDKEEYGRVWWSEEDNDGASDSWWGSLTGKEESNADHADLAALIAAHDWERNVSHGGTSVSRTAPDEDDRGPPLEELDPGWPLQEGFVWDPQQHGSPLVVGGLTRILDDDADDSSSMSSSSSSSEVVMFATEDGGTLAVQVEYLDEELYDQIFGAPDLEMAGSLPDLPNNHAGLKVLRERWLPPWRRPCTFFMEGVCRRKHCKFSHELSSITCRFWQDGSCLKGSECPFLHGYPVLPRRRNRSEGDASTAASSSVPTDGVPLPSVPPHRHTLKHGGGGDACVGGGGGGNRRRNRLLSFEITSETDFPTLGSSTDVKENERGGDVGPTAAVQSQLQPQQQAQPQTQQRKKTKYTSITATVLQQGSGVSCSGNGGSNRSTACCAVTSNKDRHRRHTHSDQRSTSTLDSTPAPIPASASVPFSVPVAVSAPVPVPVSTTSSAHRPHHHQPARHKPRRSRKPACGGGGGGGGDGGGEDERALGGGGRVHKDGTVSDY